MPPRLHIEVGQRFHRLTIVEEAPKRRGMRHFVCRCDCGNTITTRLSSLRNGTTKSCTCLRAEQNRTVAITHGMWGSGCYSSWHGMKQRCFNPNNASYKYYGERGITVCEEWMEFEDFERWAKSNGYQAGLTIERIDVNGNYEPSNCTWIPRNQQSRNTRRTRWIAFRGERRPLAEWAKAFGKTPHLVRGRIDRGWPEVEALLTPKSTRKGP